MSKALLKYYMKYYEGPKGVSIKKITEAFFKARGPWGQGRQEAQEVLPRPWYLQLRL